MRDPIQFDSQRVMANARQADTEDLLNRVTAYRAGMEAEALAIIEAELRRRGVEAKEIEEHGEKLRSAIFLADGTAARCSFCRQPALAQGWGWHRLFGKVPVFPRFYYYCREHLKETRSRDAPAEQG